MKIPFSRSESTGLHLAVTTAGYLLFGTLFDAVPAAAVSQTLDRSDLLLLPLTVVSTTGNV